MIYELICWSFCSFIGTHLPNSEGGQSRFPCPSIDAWTASRPEVSGGDGTLGHRAAGTARLGALAHWALRSHPGGRLRGAEIPLPTSLVRRVIFHLSGLLLRHLAALGPLGILITPMLLAILCAFPGRLLHVIRGRGMGADGDGSGQMLPVTHEY